MSAYRFVTLTCDICGEIWDDGESKNNRDARRAATRGGWVCKPPRDECPKHHGFRRLSMGGTSWYERVDVSPIDEGPS